MRFSRILIGAALVLAGLGVGPGTALAAAVAEIQGTDEVLTPDGEGRMLLLYGQNLTKVTSYDLERPDGTPVAPLTIVFRSKTLVGLLLPANLDQPGYPLPGNFNLKYSTKSTTNLTAVRLAAGHADEGAVQSPSLDAALREDLDHAVTADDALAVGGEVPSQLHDAGRLTGTVPVARFSAIDDLVLEGKVGTGWDQVAAGNHAHDARYPLRADLSAPGTINNAGNPVEWSQLRGVPSGLADGVDDGGLGAGLYLAGDGLVLTDGVFAVRFAGNGTALTLARSDHGHDSSYFTKAELNASGGTVNDASNPVDWGRLKGMPPGFADGDDKSETYYPGDGLDIAWNTFFVKFGGSGSAKTVAHSDHTHSNYLDIGGGTITNQFTFATSGDSIVAVTGNSSNPGSGTLSGGIDSTSANGTGLAGHGNVGVLGDLDSDGTYAVWGNAPYKYQTAVQASAGGDYGSAVDAYATGANSTALRAYDTGRNGRAIVASTSDTYSTTMGIYGAYRGTAARFQAGRYGTAVYAYSYRGTSVRAQARGYGTALYAYSDRGSAVRARSSRYGTGVYSYAYRGTALQGYVRGYASCGLRVGGTYSRNLALFQRYGSNVARIDSRGRGYFNYGTYSGGADFAESVKVDEPVAEFEPGDVMIIDADSRRRFSLSRTANSTLVAGVVSTRPALVGSTHAVASERQARRLSEEVKLGIVGIVPTKVCAEGGEIRAGDLLVSSSTPGHAMKAPAQPAVGTVIGKALEPLKEGTGKIEVLLMAR